MTPLRSAPARLERDELLARRDTKIRQSAELPLLEAATFEPEPRTRPRTISKYRTPPSKPPHSPCSASPNALSLTRDTEEDSSDGTCIRRRRQPERDGVEEDILGGSACISPIELGVPFYYRRPAIARGPFAQLLKEREEIRQRRGYADSPTPLGRAGRGREVLADSPNWSAVASDEEENDAGDRTGEHNGNESFGQQAKAEAAQQEALVRSDALRVALDLDVTSHGSAELARPATPHSSAPAYLQHEAPPQMRLLRHVSLPLRVRKLLEDEGSHMQRSFARVHPRRTHSYPVARTPRRLSSASQPRSASQPPPWTRMRLITAPSPAIPAARTVQQLDLIARGMSDEHAEAFAALSFEDDWGV